MKDPNVKCLNCGIDFYKFPNQIKRYPNHFCSNKCRGLHQNKKIEVKCLTCGIDFYKLPNQIKKYSNHFCSNKCNGLHQNKKIEVECSNCEVIFLKKISQIKLSHMNFCSRKCNGNFHDKSVQVQCKSCEVFFLKKLSDVKKTLHHFCSQKCYSHYQDKKVEVNCFNCKKLFRKKQSEVKRCPRHCCSRYCSQMLAKYNKNWGSSRSKLEIYVEKRLTEELALNISYNDTSIGYELDIYLPEMSFAIELNGVFHYKAIYGEEALLKRQEIDRLKAEECVKRNIKLIVINVSEDKNNKKTFEKRYNEIKKLILSRLEEYKQQLSQPITLEL